MAERSWDLNFELPCLTSLQSVAAQTYPHWSLVVIGDGLTDAQVARLRKVFDALSIGPDRFWFQNMDGRLRERVVYNPTDVWKFAGVNALNIGLHIAYNLTHASHIARIDDDDAWGSNHLENLAAAYKLFPNATFAVSQSVGHSDKPFPGLLDLHTTFGLYPPQPCGMMHAATSWSARHQLFYQQEWEQKEQPRHKEPCCHAGPCENGTVLPADADMWERMRGMLRDGLLVAVAVKKNPNV